MNKKIYFLQYAIELTEQSQYYNEVENSIVSCWIKDTDGISASVKANFFIRKYDWDIGEVIQDPIEVTAEIL